MATPVQRKIERLQDKITDLSSLLEDLEDEISELSSASQEPKLDEKLTADIGDGEWTFTKREAVQAFDLLYQIGLDETRRYNLVTVEQIRLAVERILR